MIQPHIQQQILQLHVFLENIHSLKMGHTISKLKNGNKKQVENLECLDSHICSLPIELRTTIFSRLSSRDKQTLRGVCRQFASEIDKLVGPTDCISINDFKGKRTLKFFSSIYIQSLNINGPCSLQSSASVINDFPLRLKSLVLDSEGAVSPEFISNVLSRCQNLTDLNLIGSFKGLINPYGLEIQLPKLERLSLRLSLKDVHNVFDSHLTALYNVLNGRQTDLSPLKIFWNNQLSLLRRLNCSLLKDSYFYLITCESVDNYDELELYSVIIEFLQRHKSLKKLKLYHAQNPMELEYSRPLNFFNRSFRRRQQQLQNHRPQNALLHSNVLLLNNNTINIQEIEFCSKLPTQFHAHQQPNDPLTLESSIISLLKSLKKLKILKFSGTKGRSLFWSDVDQIVESNSNTLEYLELVGRLEGSIDFEKLSACSSLKVIRLSNKQKYRHASLSPIIENLRVSQKMVDNLESLILQNVGLKASDFKSLYRLRKLKNLGIYRWRCGLGEENLSYESIKGVLAIPSLRALLIPYRQTNYESFFFANLQMKLHPKEARRMGVVQYLVVERFLDSGMDTDDMVKTTPLWTKTEWGFRLNSSFS